MESVVRWMVLEAFLQRVGTGVQASYAPWLPDQWSHAQHAAWGIRHPLYAWSP